MDRLVRAVTKAAAAISGTISTLIIAVQCAWAATVPSDAGEIIGGAGSNKVVEDVGGDISNVVGSVYNGLTTIGVIIIVISLVVALVRMGVSSNANKRDEAKSSIVWGLVAGIIIGGSIAIISQLIKLGRTM